MSTKVYSKIGRKQFAKLVAAKKQAHATPKTTAPPVPLFKEQEDTMKKKTTATHTPNKPYIGQPCTVHGRECTITKVYPAGTIDVASLDGKRAWRVSGLAFQSEYVGNRMLAADLPGSY